MGYGGVKKLALFCYIIYNCYQVNKHLSFSVVLAVFDVDNHIHQVPSTYCTRLRREVDNLLYALYEGGVVFANVV